MSSPLQPVPLRLSARTARTACFALLLAGFLFFASLLDRYPEPFFDEAFFNYPAVRVLDGRPFEWPASASAPHGRLVWAYHGLLYPRLQVFTISALGPTLFACRIPQFLAVFVALALLCALLIRSGYEWSAVALPVLWLGDRALFESLFGRMDGLALLSAVLCFVMCVAAIQKRSKRLVAASAFAAALAAGFHPSAAVFGVAAFILMACSRRYEFRVLLFSLGTGATVPVLITAALVTPHFREALEQFAWNRQMASRGEFFADLVNLAGVLRWARYWQIALLLSTALLVMPAALARLRRHGPAFVDRHALAVSAALFALGGWLALASTSAYSVLPHLLFCLGHPGRAGAARTAASRPRPASAPGRRQPCSWRWHGCRAPPGTRSGGVRPSCTMASSLPRP